MPKIALYTTSRFPEMTLLAEILKIAFDDLEQVGPACSVECKHGLSPCALHFFARWTPHLHQLCMAFGLTRPRVIEGVEAALTRHYLKRFPGLSQQACRQKAIAQAISVRQARYDEPVKPYGRPCAVCGELITSGAATKRYCSEACCKVVAARRAKDHGPKPPVPCMQCGEMLPSGRGRYCSDRCAKKAHQKRQVSSLSIRRRCLQVEPVPLSLRNDCGQVSAAVQ